MIVSPKDNPNQPRAAVLPDATIGILGGGQLGRMIGLKAREMGYRIATLDPSYDSPCGQIADRQFVASFDDISAARELGRASDVLTYEFENVDARIVEELEQTFYLPQGSALLLATRHRIQEKTALQQAGIPVAPWRAVRVFEDLVRGVSELGTPCVLKTATGGYDGKGQFVLRSVDDVEKAWKVLSSPGDRGSDLILEGWVPFVKELSVIAARNPSGEIRVFPVAENIHADNILHLSMAPARIPFSVMSEAENLAVRIAEQLGVVGLIAVEMFWQDGTLLVNELAPRPHNSGHYTMDACVTSQFEQHVRAICNLPLGDTQLLSPVVMVNVLGEHAAAVRNSMVAFSDRVKVHFYGKSEAKAKRKMGHLNVLADSVEAGLDLVDEMGIWSRLS